MTAHLAQIIDQTPAPALATIIRALHEIAIRKLDAAAIRDEVADEFAARFRQQAPDEPPQGEEAPF